MLYVIPFAATISLYAEGSQPAADYRRDAHRAGRLIALLLVPGILLLYFFGGFVLSLFRTEYSDTGFGLLQLLVLVGGFVAVNGVYITQLRAEKHITPIIALSAVLSGVLIGVSYWPLPFMGILAIGIAQLASQGIVAVYVCAKWTVFFQLNPQ